MDGWIVANLYCFMASIVLKWGGGLAYVLFYYAYGNFL